MSVRGGCVDSVVDLASQSVERYAGGREGDTVTNWLTRRNEQEAER